MSDKPKRTPGPLVLEEDFIIYGADGYMVADPDCEQEEQKGKKEANAARIVECWNAMEGIGRPEKVWELIGAAQEVFDHCIPADTASANRVDRLRKALAALEMEGE